MDHRHSKTSQWVETTYVVGGALLKLYNYDGVGRVQSTTTLHIPRRTLQRLLAAIDLHEDDHAQDELPF